MCSCGAGSGRRPALSKSMMVATWTLTLLATIQMMVNLQTPVDVLSSSDKDLDVDGEATQHHKTFVKTEKRWAVMMIGSARSYAFARSSFQENVLHQIDPPMDVFTSILLANTSSCFIENHSLELLVKDSTVVRFHQMNDKLKSGRQKTQDRFINEQSALLQLIEDYSKDHDITYDYIFYTRPDHYYAIPFNIKEVERTLVGRMSTLFSPKCCKFAGWCDRLGAASYQDFSKMILSSKDWAKNGGDKYEYKSAFKHRAEYANLTNFDLTPKKDYGFLTLRLSHAAQSCKGKENVKASWVDTFCNNFTFPELETTPASCRLLNNSSSCSKWDNRIA